MRKVTDELIKMHQLVSNVLEGFESSNPRFEPIMKTLHRTVVAHGWLQDEILAPAVGNKLLIEKPFLNEIHQEHQDLDRMLKALLDTPLDLKKDLDAKVLQIRTVIETHFKKEKEAFYPLVEQ